MPKLKDLFSSERKGKSRRCRGDVWLVIHYNFGYPPHADVFDNHEAARAMFNHFRGSFDIVTIDFVPVLSDFVVA